MELGIVCTKNLNKLGSNLVRGSILLVAGAGIEPAIFRL